MRRSKFYARLLFTYCEAMVYDIAPYVIFTIPLVHVLGAVMGVAGMRWAQLLTNILVRVLSIVSA